MSDQQAAAPPPQRTRSSNSIHERDPPTNGDHSRQHHKPKQFVVSRHGHHSRVPSYGRNLNKLGGTTGAPGKQVATSPKDSSSSGGVIQKRGTGKRATFELGSPAASDSSRQNSYKEGYNTVADTDGGGIGNDRPAIARNPSTTSLMKSSSTRSLEGEHRRNSKRGPAHSRVVDRSRSKSGDRRREATAAAGRQRRAQSSDQLSEMTNTKPSTAMQRSATVAAAPTVHHPPSGMPSTTMIQAHQFKPNVPTRPLSPQESGDPVTATNITTPSTSHHPVTPAHSLPSSQEQPLTSRFLHLSASSGTDSAPKRTSLETPLPRSESTYSITSSTVAPSRTQQKLWLQRASSHAELTPHHAQAISAVPASTSDVEWLIQPSRAEKEFERVAREYMNVRRFKNPLADGIDRIRDKAGARRVIPRRTASGDAAAGNGNMGLSQSLKEAGEVRRGNRRETITQGSKDDSSVDNRGIGGESAERGAGINQVETLLRRMWTKGEMMVSNE
ncbi:TORC1 subunit TCO89-domain-containing protein [Geopyxis carbonaria]|nr:TORC1 subunit TCO89-domain-containing protein [Geopyxis carbonaria]